MSNPDIIDCDYGINITINYDEIGPKNDDDDDGWVIFEFNLKELYLKNYTDLWISYTPSSLYSDKRGKYANAMEVLRDSVEGKRIELNCGWIGREEDFDDFQFIVGFIDKPIIGERETVGVLRKLTPDDDDIAFVVLNIESDSTPTKEETPPKIKRRSKSWKGVVRNPFTVSTHADHPIFEIAKRLGWEVKVIYIPDDDEMAYGIYENIEGDYIGNKLEMEALSLFTEPRIVLSGETDCVDPEWRVEQGFNLKPWESGKLIISYPYGKKKEVDRYWEWIYRNMSMSKDTPPPKITRKTRSWKGVVRNPIHYTIIWGRQDIKRVVQNILNMLGKDGKIDIVCLEDYSSGFFVQVNVDEFDLGKITDATFNLELEAYREMGIEPKIGIALGNTSTLSSLTRDEFIKNNIPEIYDEIKRNYTIPMSTTLSSLVLYWDAILKCLMNKENKEQTGFKDLLKLKRKLPNRWKGMVRNPED